MPKTNATTPEAVIAAANAANAKTGARVYVGTSSASKVDAPSNPEFTQQVKKAYPSGDPAAMAHPARVQTERMGARYTIMAGVNKPVDPTLSGQTMRNARVLPSVMNRSGSFADGSRG